MKKIFIALLFYPFMAFAQPAPDLSQSFVESSKSWIDVDYVGDRQVGHKLDVFLPQSGKAPFPAVVAIYGSAFFSNSSKASCFTSGLGQVLLKNGFAVITINHRSSSDALWPAQIHDVKAAIRFIRASAAIFSIDPSFIGITGFSSGGHLSVMAGVTSHTKTDNIGGLAIDLEGNLGKYLETGSHVDAVVDWFGPTDFLLMDSCGSTMKHDDPKSPESSLIGGPIQDNKEKTALANPISYVSKNDPPFLIIHGNRDPLVPHCQSELLHQKLQGSGVPSELVIVDKGGHGPGVMIDTYYARMIDFFKKISKK